MDRGNYWIPVLVITSLVSPIAWVEYSAIFTETSMKYLAFPWAIYTLGSGGPLITTPLPFHSPLVSIIGIAWVILGLSLIPILRSGFRKSLWGFALLGGFFVLTLQNAIVMFGFFPTVDFVYLEILPIPTPALISFIIILEKYYRQKGS